MLHSTIDSTQDITVKAKKWTSPL